MTEQEFTSIIETYGFVIEESNTSDRWIMVNINNRYDRPMRYIEFHRKPWGASLEGSVDVYYIKPVMSIDGYILDYTVGEYDQFKTFSKPHKLKRFLDEQMADLKVWKQKILETELSWDFCNDDE